ncbi:hypothetical protein V8E53_007779 [Lactarius tabidus]
MTGLLDVIETVPAKILTSAATCMTLISTSDAQLVQCKYPKLWPQSQSWPKPPKARDSAPVSYLTKPEPPNAKPKLQLLSQARPANHYACYGAGLNRNGHRHS